jgi:hypothetical protein
MRRPIRRGETNRVRYHRRALFVFCNELEELDGNMVHALN